MQTKLSTPAARRLLLDLVFFLCGVAVGFLIDDWQQLLFDAYNSVLFR